jgi:hypothetical protein
LRISVYILAAEVSTLGGIALPGLRNPGPFVGAFLKGTLSKLPYESGGGVAAQNFISSSFQYLPGKPTFTTATYMISHLGDLDIRCTHGTFYRRQKARRSSKIRHPVLITWSPTSRSTGYLMRRHTPQPDDIPVV